MRQKADTVTVHAKATCVQHGAGSGSGAWVIRTRGPPHCVTKPRQSVKIGL